MSGGRKDSIGTKVGLALGNQAGQLTTIFVVLKLVGVIDWSWWLVLVPTWGTLGICLGVLGLVTLLTERNRS